MRFCGRGGAVERGCCSCVVGDSEAIDVEEAVARGDLMFGRDIVGVVGEKFRKVVGVDLFGE